MRPETAPPIGMVVDCSVSLAWYMADEQTDFVLSMFRQLAEVETFVPALWPLEFANGLLMALRRGRITEEWRGAVIERTSRLPIVVDAQVPSLVTISELALRHRITAYDAAYLELALRRKLALATLDAALVAAARGAGCPVLTDLERYPLPHAKAKATKKK